MLLWGLAAISVPVLIHLFLQRQQRLVRFASLRFLKLTRRRPERKKIDNWLLMALRMLLFALLALAFARPALRREPTGVDQPRVAVFVLDRSLSAQTVENGSSRWETLRKGVLAAMEKLPADTPVGLVSCAGASEVLLPLSPRDEARKAVEGLSPTFEEADLGAGLQEALRLVSRRAESAHASIYLVSDLQRASAEHVHLVQVPDDIHVELISAGSTFVPHAAIRDLRLTQEGKVQAVAANYSDAPAQNVKVTFFADDKQIEQKKVNLPAFGSANLDFTPPDLAQGFHRVRVVLEPADALAADNTRSLAVLNPEPVPTLMVEEKLNEPLARQVGYFLASALDPGGANYLVSMRYGVQRIAQGELTSRLRGDTKPRLVVLPGMQGMDVASGRALVEYVKKGGALLMFVGGNVEPQTYNAALEGAMPVLLGTAQDAAGRPGRFWNLGRVDRDGLLKVFHSARSGDLTLPRFTGRLSLTPVGDAAVGASFDDGMPAIVTRQVGAGRVGVINTSIDAAWTDWPKRRTYVPAIHSVASYLVDAAEIRSHCAAETAPAGAGAMLQLGRWAADGAFACAGPEGSTQQMRADAEGAVHHMDVRTPGFYTVSPTPESRAVRLIASVTPASEQDLSAFKAGDFLATQLHRVPATERGIFDLSHLDSEFWKIVLLLGLLLALVELYTANRSKA